MDAIERTIHTTADLRSTPTRSAGQDGQAGRGGRLIRWIVHRLATVVAVSGMSALTALSIVAAQSGSGERLLAGFVVLVLASLPGWLFVRFMVFRAGPVWTEFVLNLHRLGMDEHQNLPRPPMSSGYHTFWARGGGLRLASAPSIYRQKFVAYYGQPIGPDDADDDPLTLKTLPPVLLATAVLAAGWSAVLARDPLFSGPLVMPVDALRFGFMGAYVFIIQMLIRRFFQSDLKPSAYFAAVVRVATVLLVVLVVHHAAPIDTARYPGVEAGLAFFIGFFPLLGMQIVHKALSATFRRLIHTLKTPYPLSDLDGLNIWYEARLLEEGIEDLQNLVTGNLVDIILHTRVPVERLVDWIDQAALQLLLDPPLDDDASSRPRTDRNALRRLGVRTATDLETMFLSSERLARRDSGRPASDGGGDDAFLAGMRGVLNEPGTAGPSVTEALLRNFSNIPNLVHVRHWRDILCAEHDCASTAVSLPGQPVRTSAPPIQQPASALA